MHVPILHTLLPAPKTLGQHWPMLCFLQGDHPVGALQILFKAMHWIARWIGTFEPPLLDRFYRIWRDRPHIPLAKILRQAARIGVPIKSALLGKVVEQNLRK